MLKTFRCMDCGKDFTLDYSIDNIGIKETDSPEEKEKKISEFNKNFIIFASNICTKWLQPIVNSKDTANETKTFENKKVEETCNKYISNLKEKFSKEEQDLKKYTLEEEEKKKKELEEIKSIVEKNENHLKSLIKELEIRNKKKIIFVMISVN